MAAYPAAAPETARSFETGHRWHLALDELRRRFRKPGYALRVNACFELKRSSKFDMHFTCPDARQEESGDGG